MPKKLGNLSYTKKLGQLYFMEKSKPRDYMIAVLLNAYKN